MSKSIFLLCIIFLKISGLDGACVNSHASCASWVANGFCQNSWYTCEQKRSHCALSCNIGSCNPQRTCATAAAAVPASSSGFSCTDTDPKCPTWVQNGFCTASFYTCEQKRSYCARSCNIGGCSPQTACSSSNSGLLVVCQDTDPRCPTWKANGFCTASFYTCAQKIQSCSLTCNIGDCTRAATCSNYGQTSNATTTKTVITTTTAGTKTTTTTPLACAADWTLFESTSSCYWVGKSKKFQEAEADCISKGGHLASIHSAAENDFLNDLSKAGVTHPGSKMNTQVWVGGIDKDFANGKCDNCTCQYKWTDGTPFDFKLWMQNEPNFCEFEGCIQIMPDPMADKPIVVKEWNNQNCDLLMRAYICQKPAMK